MMKSRFGASTIGAILAVAGVAALGVAGYKVMSGNCSLCSAGTAAATTLVNASEKTPCPQGTCSGHVTKNVAQTAEAKKDGCCPLTQTTTVANTTSECATACTDGAKDCSDKTACATPCAEGTTKTVANTEKKADGCCSADKTACKEGKDGCTGDGKDGCCGGCAEKVSKTTEPAKKGS